MLALVMCLLVLGFTGAVVVHHGTRDWTDKRARTPRPNRRDLPAPAAAPRPIPPPVPPAAPASNRPGTGSGVRPAHRLRPAFVLVMATVGVGVLTGLLLAVLAVGAGLLLRSLAGSS